MSKQSQSTHLQVVSKLLDSCETKNAKRGLKALAKSADLSYLFAGASMIATIVEQLGLNQKDDPIHVVIDSALDNDIFDHCRWLAIVPLLLGDASCKCTFTVLVQGKYKDTPTQFRRVIDYIIAAELKNNVNITMVEASLTEFIDNIGLDDVTFVLNNILTKQSVDNSISATTIHNIVERGVPYIVCDVSPVSVLYRGGMLNLAGVSSSGQLIKNPYPVYFGKIKSVKYANFGYALVFDQSDENFEYDNSLLESYLGLEHFLLCRLEHHDPLKKPPFEEQGSIRLFTGVTLYPDSCHSVVEYQGDTYQLSLDKNLAVPPFSLASKDVNELSANACWALSIYGHLTYDIKRRKVA